ncbi:putative glycerol-3-phosphate acyltransferase 3 [Platanthera zijinensis]|uniref:Glycerol-3-phosphate acyltransferase 3 n=1 Tax=Platanthera zijinensis TaxID=2320716 RepID=A0AAP0ATF1_9ASPA
MPLKHRLSRPFLSLARPFFKLLLANSIFLHHRPYPTTILPKHPPPSHAPVVLPTQTLIFHVEGCLLRSSSTFPYFMLVAVEAAGGLFRALLLLFLYPALRFMGNEAGVRMMTMVCFFGVRKKSFRVGRAVLPKFLMEGVGEEGFEEVRKAGRRVGVSGMPRVMVESFLKEYLEVEVVIGREMKELCGFYTGFMQEEEGEEKVVINGGDVLGFACHGQHLHHSVFSSCKEIHRVSEAEKSRWAPLPRDKYPKPLIFHDGRLAFRPTPTATLAMFMWLPLGITLSVCRTVISIFLPTRLSVAICALTGLVNRIVSTTSAAKIRPFDSAQTHLNRPLKKPATSSGHLYICNHRTLLDPVYISASLNKPVIAVVYSLSRVSELISPIKTARLTRNKADDRRKMETLLKEGDLVVCPEGTTCREPYLLRFSPLFAELADEITPVALRVDTAMFYGTTTCGFKWLDSFYFAMNPRPMYEIQFLESISSVVSCDPRETANRVQSEIGRCLGFRCTALTRKDKYQMLAGNDGVVPTKFN